MSADSRGDRVNGDGSRLTIPEEARIRPLLDVPPGACTECCNTPLCPDGHRYRAEQPPCCGGTGRAAELRDGAQ